jgi:hypothetical protein
MLRRTKLLFNPHPLYIILGVRHLQRAGIRNLNLEQLSKEIDMKIIGVQEEIKQRTEMARKAEARQHPSDKDQAVAIIMTTLAVLLIFIAICS